MIVDGQHVVVNGRLPRLARLAAEYYDYVPNPVEFLPRLRSAGVRADVFTFLQPTRLEQPAWSFPRESEHIALLTISTYDEWFKKQINDKTRNMIRKAGKKGVEIKIRPFTDELVAGIKEIYDEVPVRQGKPFAHFGKDHETLKRDHITYFDRSEFICAHFGKELIGFLKLVHGDGTSNVMQIVSKVAHRDKAPTNALIAKAVEICAAKGVPRLHYGLWSRGGLGEFKTHHGFHRFPVVRFFVPLNPFGRLCIWIGLHRRMTDRLPIPVRDWLIAVRSKWNVMRLTPQ